jgi:predicted nucleotidyltransferase
MGNDKLAPPIGLADALFTPVQQRVLGLLFAQPDRRFQSAELIKLADSGTGAVHRQLGRLADAGLVTVTRSGNQKHYQANRNASVFAELHGLVIKTIGIVEPLRSALSPLAAHVHAAFVYGSSAKGSARENSDIDVMVISDALRYPDVYEALAPVERALARPVNPTVMTTSEWRRKRRRGDSFSARLTRQPLLFVLGSANDL